MPWAAEWSKWKQLCNLSNLNLLKLYLFMLPKKLSQKNRWCSHHRQDHDSFCEATPWLGPNCLDLSVKPHTVFIRVEEPQGSDDPLLDKALDNSGNSEKCIKSRMLHSLSPVLYTLWAFWKTTKMQGCSGLKADTSTCGKIAEDWRGGLQTCSDDLPLVSKNTYIILII